MKIMTANFTTGRGKEVKGKTLAEVLEAADLNWEPEIKAMIDPYTMLASEDTFGMFRSDTHAKIGTVGARYVPVSHKESLALLDLIAAQDEAACFVNAGHFDNGAKVFAQLALGHSFNVVGIDPIKPYASLTTAHDGSLNVGLSIGTVRIVCQNTFMMNYKEAMKSGLKFKHTQASVEGMARAEKLLQETRLSTAALEEKFNILASKEMTKELWEEYKAMLCPKTETKNGDETARAAELTNAFFIENLADLPEIRNTAWQALNAATFQTSHSTNAKNGQKRYGDAAHLLPTGSAFKRNNQAFNWLLEHVAQMPNAMATQPKLFSIPQASGIAEFANVATFGDFADDAPLVQGVQLN